MRKSNRNRYTDYVAFINDIRLIFSNAKKFNRNFMETDVISKRVYDAAEFFEELVRSQLFHVCFICTSSIVFCTRSLLLMLRRKLRGSTFDEEKRL